VAQLTFGEFQGSDVDITFVQQAFSLLVATLGLSGFALVLALVEQAFLESLEGNVKARRFPAALRRRRGGARGRTSYLSARVGGQ